MARDAEADLHDRVRRCEQQVADMTTLLEAARGELAKAEEALRSRAEVELRHALETLAPQLGAGIVVLDGADRPVAGDEEGEGPAQLLELAQAARRCAPRSVERGGVVAVAVGATEQFVVVLDRGAA
jgi:hypothetical protein